MSEHHVGHAGGGAGAGSAVAPVAVPVVVVESAAAHSWQSLHSSVPPVTRTHDLLENVPPPRAGQWRARRSGSEWRAGGRPRTDLHLAPRRAYWPRVGACFAGGALGGATRVRGAPRGAASRVAAGLEVAQRSAVWTRVRHGRRRGEHDGARRQHKKQARESHVGSAPADHNRCSSPAAVTQLVCIAVKHESPSGATQASDVRSEASRCSCESSDDRQQ